MSKFIFITSLFEGAALFPELREGYSIIVDADTVEWEKAFLHICRNFDLEKCELISFWGGDSDLAEDYVDSWMISNPESKVFFPTVSGNNLDDLWYTIQTDFVVVFTLSHEIMSSIYKILNDEEAL